MAGCRDSMQSDIINLSNSCSGQSISSGQQSYVIEKDVCGENSVSSDCRIDSVALVDSDCLTECSGISSSSKQSNTYPHVDPSTCSTFRLNGKCKSECKHVETEKKQSEINGKLFYQDHVSNSGAEHVSGAAKCVNYSCAGVWEHCDNDVEGNKNCAGIDDGKTFANDALGKKRIESYDKHLAGDESNENCSTTEADAKITDSESDSDLSETIDGIANEADDDSVTAGQHALSGPLRTGRTSRRRRQNGSGLHEPGLRHIALPESMMPQWRAVGRQWGLQNDDDIARILIRHYEDIVAGRPPRGPLHPRCQDCGEVLTALPCLACGPNQHSSRLSHDQDNGTSSNRQKGDSGRSRD